MRFQNIGFIMLVSDYDNLPNSLVASLAAAIIKSSVMLKKASWFCKQFMTGCLEIIILLMS